MNKKKETFIPIKGYNGLYKVSNRGRIKSLDKMVKHPAGCLRLFKGRIMKQTLNNQGYYYVDLTKNYTRRRYYVHRLVAINFINNNKNKPEVNHINGKPTNNNLKNLEWVTRVENQRHSWEKLNRKPNRLGFTGKRHKNVKKVLQIDKDKNIIKTWYGARDAGRNGFNHACIYDCCHGRQNTHKGFYWKFNYETKE